MLTHLRIALGSLAAFKTRTAMAMLGVCFGALSLCGSLHVARAMVRQAEIETVQLGPNLMMALAGSFRLGRFGGDEAPGRAPFSVADAETLVAHLPGVAKAAAFAALVSDIRHGEQTVKCQLLAVQADFPDVRSFRPALGRFFTGPEETQRARVCVLGRKIAASLFPDQPIEAALGQTVILLGAPLEVVGVMEEKGADVTGRDQDEYVFLPLSTYIWRLTRNSWINGVFLQMEPGADLQAAKENAEGVLRLRRRTPPGFRDDFQVYLAEDRMRLKREALALVQSLGALAAAVSFSIGGLSILSVMVLMVRLRRREIGVRRALGARRRDIVAQFLFESWLIAFAGGAAGAVGALLVVTGVYRYMDLPHVYSLWYVLGTLAGATLLGLGAGAAPAKNASRGEIVRLLRA